MSEELFDDSRFGEETEVSANTMDWGRPGDFIQGTFVKARHGIETQFGTNSIYEILADKGSFYKLTKKKPADESTVINNGEVWSIWGRTDIFNSMMNNLKPGQVVKIAYVEDKETQMGEAKIVKIFAPKNNDGTPLMNQAWLETQSVSGADF